MLIFAGWLPQVEVFGWMGGRWSSNVGRHRGPVVHRCIAGLVHAVEPSGPAGNGTRLFTFHGCSCCTGAARDQRHRPVPGRRRRWR